MRILVINGPNLNMLGVREQSVYGEIKLDKICSRMEEIVRERGAEIEFYQSNHEGEIIDRIQQARGQTDILIFNPGGFTHTSVAIRDAVLAAEVPMIEVHISNVARREKFRQHSYFSDIAIGTISGFGEHSYYMALDAALEMEKE